MPMVKFHILIAGLALTSSFVSCSDSISEARSGVKNNRISDTVVVEHRLLENDQDTKGHESWQRVVSLHDNTSEIMVALELVDRLVGVSDTVSIAPQFRDKLVDVPLVENLESILSTNPDVVIGSKVTATRSPDLVTQLRQRGISVYLPDFSNLNRLVRVVKNIAQHMDATPRSDAVLQRFAPFVQKSEASQDEAPELGQNQGQIQGQVQSQPRSPLRVFVYDCCDPPFTAGENTMLNELIERAGGNNIFSNLESSWTHVGWEAVLVQQPEVIVVNDYSMEGQSDVDGKIDQLRRFTSLYKLPRIILPLHQVLGGLTSIDALYSLQNFFDQYGKSP